MEPDEVAAAVVAVAAGRVGGGRSREFRSITSKDPFRDWFKDGIWN